LTRRIIGTSNVFCREIYIAFASTVFLEVRIGATLTFILHCPHMVVFTAQQQNTPTETASATLVCAGDFFLQLLALQQNTYTKPSSSHLPHFTIIAILCTSTFFASNPCVVMLYISHGIIEYNKDVPAAKPQFVAPEGVHPLDVYEYLRLIATPIPTTRDAHALLRNRIAAFRLCERNTREDGNCQFDAVADQLQYFSHPNTCSYKEVR
jgi:hypothetical protein